MAIANVFFGMFLKRFGAMRVGIVQFGRVDKVTNKGMLGQDFLLYLAPEASSALVASQEDFVDVCDFVFFVAASCEEKDALRRELHRKALFDLLKNYAYK